SCLLRMTLASERARNLCDAVLSTVSVEERHGRPTTVARDSCEDRRSVRIRDSGGPPGDVPRLNWPQSGLIRPPRRAGRAVAAGQLPAPARPSAAGRSQSAGRVVLEE